MKKSIVFFIALLFAILIGKNTNAQTGFARVFYDNNGNVLSNVILPTADNGAIVAGEKDDQGLLMKVDSSGDMVWKTCYRLMGEYSQGAFTNLIPTSDSCFIAAGAFFSSDTAANVLTLFKFNDEGDTIWTGFYGFGTFITLSSIRSTSDNGLVATGFTMNRNAPINEIFICKFSSSGAMEWSKLISDGTNLIQGRSIQQTQDSGFVITGYAQQSSPYLGQSILLKLTANAELSWAKSFTINNVQYLTANDILVTDDGYLICLNKSSSWMMDDAVIVKTDLGGNVIWSKNYPSFTWMYQYNGPIIKLHKISDGSFLLVCGQVLKIDSQGSLIWARSPFMVTTDATECRDKGLMIVGDGPIMAVKKAVHYNAHIGIIKTDSHGLNSGLCINDGSIELHIDTLVTTDVSYQVSEKGSPVSYRAVIDAVLLDSEIGCVSVVGGINENATENDFKIYPNPSNSLIHIVVNTKETIQKLEIVDPQGKMRITIEKPEISTTAVDVSNLTNGVYVVRLTTSHNSLTRKLIISH
jgi:hypothetical protein